MPLDIVSYLMGQKNGGGAGGGSYPLLDGVAGYISSKALDSLSAFDFTIANSVGKFAAVLCWTRATVTPPADGSIVYTYSQNIDGTLLYTTLIKVPITSDDFSIHVTCAQSTQSGAICFVVSSDFTANVLAAAQGLHQSVTVPPGFSIFVAHSRFQESGIGRWANTNGCVTYLFPKDVATTDSTLIRILPGYVQTANGITADLGFNSNNTTGSFVCINLVAAAE